MTVTAEDSWAVQVSVKHGASLEAMTNVRGPDFATVAGHWGEGAAFGSQIHQSINQFLALGGGQAPPIAAVAVTPSAPAAPAFNGGAKQRPCPINAGVVHNFREGVKNNKPWQAWFCSKDVCAPEWVDR